MSQASTSSVNSDYGPEHDHRCGDRLPRGETGCGRMYKHRHRGGALPKPGHQERPGQCPYEDCGQYREDCDVPTSYPVLVSRNINRGSRAGKRVQCARRTSEAGDRAPSPDGDGGAAKDAGVSGVGVSDKIGDDLLHWMQHKSYARARTTNLRVGLRTEAVRYLNEKYPTITASDVTRLVGPLVDIAMRESPEEQYFAESLNHPGAMESLLKAHLAATKGVLESVKPASLLRMAGAMAVSTGGTMVSGLAGYFASKVADSLLPKVLVGAAVAGVGVLASNYAAARLLRPVKVTVTLPTM